ncbi:hypothetical protein [Natrinema altunense]|uniref:Uncharacterized protein n=1 Tax=Natrinema altunense TaxID=222984 RepID=A0A482XTG9_9EURY|nr:hypothetical protein [Natrinema altunense]RZH66411.1 hypothetical protein ELS17_17170 [Natrinema altunense]
MDDDQYLMLTAHLRAIRSAIVALAFAVLAVATIISGDKSWTAYLLFISIAVCVYSFIQTADNP